MGSKLDNPIGMHKVKRKLWGLLTVVKTIKDYLIGTEVVIETSCLPNQVEGMTLRNQNTSMNGRSSTSTSITLS